MRIITEQDAIEYIIQTVLNNYDSAEDCAKAFILESIDLHVGKKVISKMSLKEILIQCCMKQPFKIVENNKATNILYGNKK